MFGLEKKVKAPGIDTGKTPTKKLVLFYAGKLCFSRAVLSNRNIIQATYEMFYLIVVKLKK